MRKIIYTTVAAAAVLAGTVGAAAPAMASNAAPAAVVPCPDGNPAETGILHIRLANCVGGLPADLGRGIRITATGAVQLRTANLANLRLTHWTDPAPNPNGGWYLGTFRIKHGTKFLRVNKTGSYLGNTPMLFGEYPGPGYDGPRPIYRASADGGPPLASKLALTASGIVLKLAPVVGDGTGPPDLNQIWAIYPAG